MRNTAVLALTLTLALSACKAAPDTAPAGQATAPAAASPGAPAATPEQTAERGFAALRKIDPDFERLGYSHLVGDLDQDGQNDLVVLYGTGTPDATMAAMQQMAVLMARPGGPQALPESDMPDFCPQLDKIEAGKLYLHQIDICSAARPKATDYYVYAWNGKTIVQAEHQTMPQHVLAELKPLGAAFRARDSKVVLDAMTFPLEASNWPVYDTPLAKAAEAAGGKIDRAMAEKHYADLFPNDRADLYADAIDKLKDLPLKTDASGAASSNSPGPDGLSYGLVVQPDPEEDREESNDNRIIDARVDLGMAEGDGGQNLVLLLTEGRLKIAAMNTGG